MQLKFYMFQNYLFINYMNIIFCASVFAINKSYIIPTIQCQCKATSNGLLVTVIKALP